MLKRTRGGQVDEETELFEYNELNQLTKYTDVDGNSTTYKYNPDGMRTSKINNGAETLCLAIFDCKEKKILIIVVFYQKIS